MIRKKLLPVLLLFAVLGILFACSHKQPAEQSASTVDSLSFLVEHPEWAKNAVIYEVNIRQYTKSGTFKEFEEHLPRLKELGVDILWFMPVFPIGELNRKATQTKLAQEFSDPKEQEKYLGSYYAIKDYMAINPEFGTMEEFVSLVKKIHEMGMFVILDIAVNHTAWDHPWVESHPDYYMRIEEGATPWNKEWMEQHPAFYQWLQEKRMTYPIHPGETDWWDTAELNFDNQDLRNEFVEIFKFWIEKANIDGYRCDVAGDVPVDFWDNLRPGLDKLKPVFMLAESDRVEHHRIAFNASYAWEFHHLMNKIAKGEKNALDIDSFYTRESSRFPQNAIRMQFIDNHDENSWKGTVKSRLGEAANSFAVLYYTFPGMPLIYSGQEAGLDKSLKFFEKDFIDWDKDKNLASFYTKLNMLKKQNSALWNGNSGAPLVRLKTDKDSQVFAFVRENENNKVLVVINLSKEPVKTTLQTNIDFSGMKSYFDQDVFGSKSFNLKAWEYKVYVN